jgi:hypothetical protein
MRQIVSAACGLWLAFAGGALAQGSDAGSPVLVELYTSQGCSSCPPADVLLGQLTKDPRVIALALHVDYWDYLGWKDEFARPEFTKRQKAYARAAGTKMIYTPQMIVAGQDSVIGTREDAVEMAIRNHVMAAQARGQTVRLTLHREGDQIVVRAEAVPPTDRGLRVQLVRYVPERQVEIRHGENAGHTLTYHNIVTSWQVLGDWRANAPLTLTAPAPGPERAVVIIQDDGPGAVLAAAELR